MTGSTRSGADNVLYLEQALALVRAIADEHYRGDPGRPGGVGAQLRHCVDFYTCFLRGLEVRRIDYTNRDRDPRVEHDRAHALTCLESLVDALGRLPESCMDDEVQVRLERADPLSAAWCRSTVLRELQFLLSHTIHHYALIALLLERRGIDAQAAAGDFGVAPSTVQHWKTARLEAR